MSWEKRHLKRSDIFLIINFRLRKKSTEYSLGITRNITPEGCSFETHHLDHHPGEVLDLVLTHPESNLIVSLPGEVVWKKYGWYECVMGVKLNKMDPAHEASIQKLISAEYKKNGRSFHGGNNKSNAPARIINTPHTGSGGKQKIESLQGTGYNKKNTFKRGHSYFYLVSLCTAILMVVLTLAFDSSKPLSRTAAHPLTGSIMSKSVQYHEGLVRPEDAIRNKSDVPAVTRPERIRSQATAAPASRHVEVVRSAIHFAKNSDSVAPGHYADIEQAADLLISNERSISRVEGHTDSAGPELYNMDLSVRRAAAVKNMLVERGVSPSRINIVSYGHAVPAASNNTRSGRMKNRRVEISVIDVQP